MRRTMTLIAATALGLGLLFTTTGGATAQEGNTYECQKITTSDDSRAVQATQFFRAPSPGPDGLVGFHCTPVSAAGGSGNTTGQLLCDAGPSYPSGIVVGGRLCSAGA